MEHSVRTVAIQEVSIIDSFAIMWYIHYWPTKGTVQDYGIFFKGYILRKFKTSNVHLVFDR